MIHNYSEQVDRNNAKKSLRKGESHPRPVPPPNENYVLKEYFITIDSRDRDRMLWPMANRFQVKMDPENTFAGATVGRSFKNVRSIEVVTVQFPNTNNVLNQMYLYLNFPEIDGVYESTNLAGTKALAKLIPTSLLGNYVYVQFETKYPKRIFPGKGVRIDRLTPEFRTYDGTLFDFGLDTVPPNPYNPLVQTSMTLRVIVQIPNTI